MKQIYILRRSNSESLFKLWHLQHPFASWMTSMRFLSCKYIRFHVLLFPARRFMYQIWPVPLERKKKSCCGSIYPSLCRVVVSHSYSQPQEFKPTFSAMANQCWATEHRQQGRHWLSGLVKFAIWRQTNEIDPNDQLCFKVAPTWMDANMGHDLQMFFQCIGIKWNKWSWETTLSQ